MTNRYIPSKPCKRGHRERFSSGACVQCTANKGKTVSNERWKAYAKQHRKEKPEQQAEANRRWRQKNPGVVAELRAQRRVAITSPLSVRHQKQMIEIYSACPKGHEVDHIIPINNPVVCGLHVPWNLQYLDMPSNRAKGNRL